MDFNIVRLLEEPSNEKQSLMGRIQNAFTSKTTFFGQIIGDGRQDFTKDYHEYNLNINGKPIMLIDVPGIEGNEQIYADRIGEALHKAHVLFYVNGHNKPVDAATAKKIQQYLCHGVKVKLVQNIRGNADQYEFPEDRTNLMSAAIQRMLTTEDQKFKGIFQDRYDGCIGVQGLVAFCSNARIHSNRKDLIRVQDKLHSYFKEDCNHNLEEAKVAMRRFSKIDALISILDAKSREYKKEIVAANTLKLHGIVNILLQEYKGIIIKEKDQFERYKTLLEAFQRSVDSDVYSCISNYRNSLNNEVARMHRELRNSVLEHVARSQFNVISGEVNSFNKQVNEKISSLATRAIGNLSENIKERSKTISGIPGISQSANLSQLQISCNLKLDVSAISDEDDISFGDVCTSIGGTASGALTGLAIGGPIGAAVGGVFGFIFGNVKAGSNQTERATKKANDLLDQQKKKIEAELTRISSQFEREVKQKISSQMKEIRSQSASIKSYYDATERAEQLLNKEINKYMS